MIYRPKPQFWLPANWQDFEHLCWSLWKSIWNDPGTLRNGRSGQPQHGVDIYGRPQKGETWAGVQCKGTENFTNPKLTETELISEVEVKKAMVSTIPRGWLGQTEDIANAALYLASDESSMVTGLSLDVDGGRGI